MALWEIESDLRLVPASDDVQVEMDAFALRCYGELGRRGAADLILTADPATKAVHANFVLNSVSRPEHANTNALRILADVTESLADADWRVVASGVAVTPAD